MCIYFKIIFTLNFIIIRPHLSLIHLIYEKTIMYIFTYTCNVSEGRPASIILILSPNIILSKLYLAVTNVHL